MKRLLLIFTACTLLFTASCSSGSTETSSAAESSEEASSAIISEASSASNESKPNDYSKQTYMISDSLNNLKVNGRYLTVGKDANSPLDKGISCDSTACGIEWNADCEGDVVLNIVPTMPNNAVGLALDLYFTVVVDGVQQDRVKVTGVIGTPVDRPITIATGLSKGSHSFAIYRQSESMKGNVTLKSITLNGQFTSRPADKDLYIEFIGDSITAGYGNLGNLNSENGSAAIYQDGMQTFATITANKLDADCLVIALSGLGISTGLSGNKCQYYYENTSWKRGKTAYDFAKQPDVVVINLHTNDYDKRNTENLTEDKFKADSISFFNYVREKNPKAKIVWAYGMMNKGFATQIKEAITELGGADKGFYSVVLSTGDAERGGDWHPSVAGHKNAADDLTSFIKGII